MSSLTGQQINQSYKGLLKLTDSSTGITQSFQQIQDGEGNDTGLRIKQNAILAPNILSLPVVSTPKAGMGMNQSTGMEYALDEYDSMIAFPFYDMGVNSYSSMSYSVSAVTSTSDVVEIAFYTTQYKDRYGFVPYQLILTGGTLITNSTGTKTLTFPSDLSFSATGAGIYFAVLKTTNVGATPTVKFRTNLTQPIFPTFLENFYGQYGSTSSLFLTSNLFNTDRCISMYNLSASPQFETEFTDALLVFYNTVPTLMTFPGFVLRRKASIV